MRWELRGSKQQPKAATQHPRRDQEQQDGKRKSKPAVFSFSPLAWLSKLTAWNSGVAAAAKSEQAARSPAKSTAQAAASLPPYVHKLASSSSASASQSSPAGSSSSAAATAAGTESDAAAVVDIAPRRRSVGNDDTESDAAAARQRQNLYRRHHYSVGGDRDLLPLGHPISLSRFAFPKPPPATPAPVRTLTPPTLPPMPSPSDTDEDENKRPRSRRRRPRRSGGRRSFSYGNKAPGARVAAAVRVRSPRPCGAAVSELERFAVVRRTRDPQREFRASMVAMIVSKRMVGRPEELETLLACYLSLNADEHHDCIVKVFRQVWFELNNSVRAAAPSLRS
jgi:uncharacterized protein (TIGR01568 family)